MSTAPNYFAVLNGINVSEHLERKGGFAYLSWPFAVAQLRLADASAVWEVRRFDGKPYLVTEAGIFVEVAVTVQGVTLSQIHPVLDGRNRPIVAPTCFDINTSLQRCLVKAIALHGVGLYVYAGEDLPAGAAVVEAANDDAHNGLVDAAQCAQIEALLIEVNGDRDRLVAYFGVDSLAQIRASDFPRVVRSLEKRRAA